MVDIREAKQEVSRVKRKLKVKIKILFLCNSTHLPLRFFTATSLLAGRHKIFNQYKKKSNIKTTLTAQSHLYFNQQLSRNEKISLRTKETRIQS